SDNILMDIHILPLMSRDAVFYTNIECAIDQLVTDRLFYSVDITLPPGQYNDPQGYTVVWERCCRNVNITNVNSTGFNVGQTFILDFPPVVDESGDPFVNSSPILFPPLRDYGCTGDFYYVDFSGEDPDGDEIVYSLVTPLNSSSTQAVPVPTPPSHPEVTWQPGFSEDNMIPGNPALSISEKGLITVTPEAIGLYLFAVRVEEFRDGEKIGEVRRDFQMLVIDCPDPGKKPKIRAQVPGETVFLKDLDTLFFPVTQESKCLDVLVTDQDGKENISLKALPVNFDLELDTLFTVDQGFIEGTNEELVVQICFPQCPFLEDEPAIIDLVALDDACPLPLQDTLRLVIDIEAPFNNDPVFTNSDKDIKIQVREGEVIELSMTGVDADLDSMFLEMITKKFDEDDYDIELEIIKDEPGEIRALFSWDTGCKTQDYNKRQNFKFQFVLNDADFCQFVGEPDTIFLSVNVELPTNNPPVVTSDLVSSKISFFLQDTINFKVKATDADNDNITLTAIPVDFGFDSLLITFEDKEGIGKLNSDFNWPLDCDIIDLEEKDEYLVYFVVEDADKCKITQADTLAVTLKLLPPLNDTPRVSIEGQTENRFEILVGTKIALDILGSDTRNDFIDLYLVNREALGSADFNFEDISGIGNVSSKLSWSLKCSNLNEGFTPREYEFIFAINDDDCLERLSDTLSITVVLSDVISDPDIDDPPNVFTPNGDGINDLYFIGSLPPNNCVNEFKSVRIFNRWGKLVFGDETQDFIWDGGGSPSGVYYYQIEYNNFEYKGTVSILE
ncbi:MAG: gliding motility-associated C-terminal domain-containing protein, partial [Bacteroidetes bacterium]|nr:gliding motility-associated C-terminal domain-containing protein [Bacteroidota bacterium]